MAGGAPGVVAYVASAPEMDASRRAGVLPLARGFADRAGVVLLSTCHRVELYAASPLDGDEALLAAGCRQAVGESAVRHIVEVAVGLESAVLAEDQILHQFRCAVGDARRLGRLGPDLGRTVDAGLRAGRLARSWRPAGQAAPGRSLAEAALDRATAAVGSLAGRRVLVVGAGVMGEAAVRGARAAGARVAVASRTRSHAEDVAGRHSVEAWPLDPGSRLAEVELVVIALGASWPLGGRSLDVLVDRPFVIDLSMPPALPDGVRVALGSRLLGIDDLAVPAFAAPAAERYRARLWELADRTVASVLAASGWEEATGPAHLASRIEDQRRRELEAYLRRRPELDEEARAALDEATRAMAARLFRVPLERLSHDPDGARRRAVEELFGA